MFGIGQTGQPNSRNSSNSTNAMGMVSKYGDLGKMLLCAVLALAVYVVFVFVELIYQYIKRLSINRTELMPNTYVMDSKSITVQQNPRIANSKPVHLSENERSGIEFSYAFYLNVSASAFTQYDGLFHIFHKGYPSMFPLMGPGVFMHSNKNTMRVYMNTHQTWNHYVDIDNFPVGKWVHVVIACTQDAMHIYINGNLSKKVSFEGYTPYQNYQDIICFSKAQKTFTRDKVSSVDESGLTIRGECKGLLSRLLYFNYALSYSEITTLMNEGPSANMDDSAMSEVPPYLADNWWTNQ
jgi:hypothetical protein